MRLTLRTLLAYRTGYLAPRQMREIADKLSRSELAQSLVAQIDQVLAEPQASPTTVLEPESVGRNEPDLFEADLIASYLSDDLSPEEVSEVEMRCMVNSVQLEEVAACTEILAQLFIQPVRIKSALRRRVLARIQEDLANARPNQPAPPADSPQPPRPPPLPS